MKATLATLVVFLALAMPLAAQTTLRVTSTPAGAKIYLGGYYKGLTPLTVKLKNPSATAKVYKVSVLKGGYAKWTTSVTLAKGQHKSTVATLKRGTGSDLEVQPTRKGGALKSDKPAVYPAAGFSGGLAGKVICIDPGHPSETSDGTRGPKITEMRANWLVALKLKALLVAQGVRVVMTKSAEKEKVVNRRRAEISNAAGASLMIRLHCDSAGGPGLAVYYPDRQGTKFGVTGPSKTVIASSRRAAQAFYPVVIAALRGKIGGKGIHGDSGSYIGAKQGALTGSIFSKVPVFTVEMAVLTQKHDDDFMASDAGQSAMAKALVAGLAAVVK